MNSYSLIAAVSENLVIGKDNRMPWHVPEDLRQFKRRTTGNIIVMGRKTFESIGKALPGRTTIVITSNPGDFNSRYSAVGLHTAESLDKALRAAEELDGEIFIAGGASVYRQAIEGAGKLYISKIPGIYDGDTFFPEFRDGRWELESAEPDQGFTLEVYRRK